MKSGVQIATSNNGGSKIGLEEDDDIFYASRNYLSSFRSGRTSRPTMISAKYRQKEERRKVLKISINKLKKIEDPESSLRRSVLINNTMKRLQREAREEKMQKQQSVSSSFSRCFASDFLKDNENTVDPMCAQSVRSTEQLVDITNLPEMNIVKTVAVKSNAVGTEDCLGRNETVTGVVTESVLSSPSITTEGGCSASRKRPFDDVDDCDVQAVLSQFYIPLTPRMLTSIDDDDEDADDNEDEDVNVVDLDTPTFAKRSRPDEPSAADRLKNVTRNQTHRESSSSQNSEHRLTMASSGSDRVSERSITGNCNSYSNNSGSFSCGHSSLFNEFQSVVYHNLIASLET